MHRDQQQELRTTDLGSVLQRRAISDSQCRSARVFDVDDDDSRILDDADATATDRQHVRGNGTRCPRRRRQPAHPGLSTIVQLGELDAACPADVQLLRRSQRRSYIHPEQYCEHGVLRHERLKTNDDGIWKL